MGRINHSRGHQMVRGPGQSKKLGGIHDARTSQGIVQKPALNLRNQLIFRQWTKSWRKMDKTTAATETNCAVIFYLSCSTSSKLFRFDRNSFLGWVSRNNKMGVCGLCQTQLGRKEDCDSQLNSHRLFKSKVLQ